ncbi:ACP S-malonyltransferase [bacterium]|nr:ACP S-malonyltransferase [bacterium]
MGKRAFVFPGQASQYVGMGIDLYEAYSIAKELFERANEALKFDLTKICFDGPEEMLKMTEITQPAILTISTILGELLMENGENPDFVAGHSLGEFSAVVFARGLFFEDAVKIVNLRGKFMQEAVPIGEGAMAAVMGGQLDKINEICEKASSSGVVCASNINCPGQIVISGAALAVNKAGELLKEAGIKKIFTLPVSAPFHCDLMESAKEKLKEVLKKTEFRDLKVPLINNADVKVLTKGDDIRKSFIKQVVSPVRWEDSVRLLIKKGVNHFTEVGPGKVLTGFIDRIDRDVEKHSVCDVNSFTEYLNRG